MWRKDQICEKVFVLGTTAFVYGKNYGLRHHLRQHRTVGVVMCMPWLQAITQRAHVKANPSVEFINKLVNGI
jgi:hypothetical protein